MVRNLPLWQRVSAYAVILRSGRDGEQILLSRLAPRISPSEMWTLPGGGVDHGEDPRLAVVREVYEETGLDAAVGDEARVYSAHTPDARRGGARVDAHALRIVYDGWVPADARAPRVTEVDGSTVDAAWHRLSDVVSGTVPVAAMVIEALADHRPFRLQRLAAYALITRGEGAEHEVLLTRISARGHLPGAWTLPGGGVDHGERPAAALEREVAEECGIACEVGDLLDVHDVHFAGTAPSGRHEDYHGVHLIFAATVPAGARPRVTEADGTTDAVEWVRVADVTEGRREVLEVVRHALGVG